MHLLKCKVKKDFVAASEDYRGMKQPIKKLEKGEIVYFYAENAKQHVINGSVILLNELEHDEVENNKANHVETPTTNEVVDEEIIETGDDETIEENESSDEVVETENQENTTEENQEPTAIEASGEGDEEIILE